jgi:hypothetical protein
MAESCIEAMMAARGDPASPHIASKLAAFEQILRTFLALRYCSRLASDD